MNNKKWQILGLLGLFLGLLISLPGTYNLLLDRGKYVVKKEYVKEYQNGKGYFTTSLAVLTFLTDYVYDISFEIRTDNAAGMGVKINKIDYKVYKNGIEIKPEGEYSWNAIPYFTEFTIGAAGGIGDHIELDQYDIISLEGIANLSFKDDTSISEEIFDLDLSILLLIPQWLDVHVLFYFYYILFIQHILGIGLSFAFFGYSTIMLIKNRFKSY